jgi:hypothetical protein
MCIICILISVVQFVMATKTKPKRGKGSESGTYIISSWKAVSDGYFADVYVPLITQEITELNRVLIFLHLNPASTVSLPLRLCAANPYCATIDAVYRKETVRLIWTSLGDNMAVEPPTLTISVMTINNRRLRLHPKVNLNNYSVVVDAFFTTDDDLLD